MMSSVALYVSTFTHSHLHFSDLLQLVTFFAMMSSVALYVSTFTHSHLHFSDFLQHQGGAARQIACELTNLNQVKKN